MIVKLEAPSNELHTITLPVSLPMTFESSLATVSLPITLPMQFSSRERVQVVYPTTITCEYLGKQKESRVLTAQSLGSKDITIRTEHTLFNFEGLVIEEIVNDTANETLIISEIVQSRILVGVENVNRNQVRVSWSGNKVPGIEVYLKEQADEEYGKPIGTYKWEDKFCDIDIQAYAYDIKLLGILDSGQSPTVSIDEPFGYYIDSKETISLNEKVYDLDVKVSEVHKIIVDL